MIRGTKRSGSPLDGGSAKLIIVGVAKNGVSSRVAHPRELTEENDAPESLPGTGILAEGACFSHFCCFLTPNDVFSKLQ